jgi:hypothetical protein
MRALLIIWYAVQAAATAAAILAAIVQACRPEQEEPHPWK